MRGISISLIIIVSIIIILFLGWTRLPDMLANNLSKKFGAPVSVESIRFSPTKITVKEIELGNPRGYTMARAFSAKKIAIKAPLTRYLSEDLNVDEIVMDDIYLGLEFDSSSSPDGNWTVLMQNYSRKAGLEKKDDKDVKIKRIELNNITTDVMFRQDGGGARRLPNIGQIVLTDINTEGGSFIDQLMSSVLGQMLRSVFLRQNLSNMLKGFFDSPGGAVDKFVEPFKGIFNMNPTKYHEDIA